MIKSVVLALLVVIRTVGLAPASDTVAFKATNEGGDPVALTGKLTRPQGEGAFPAIVLMHCCGGIQNHHDLWAQRFASWGYVSLQVDSFGPRGASNICDDLALIPHSMRVQDAYDAKAYLARLPFVDPNRIAVVGWSHGGWATFLTVCKSTCIEKRGGSFRAAVAFTPGCNLPLDDLDAPLLVLIGELDDSAPVGMCTLKMPRGKHNAHEIILKVYPGVYHAFGWEEMNMIYMGHRLQYDVEAAADAILQVREFLAEHLE